MSIRWLARVACVGMAVAMGGMPGIAAADDATASDAAQAGSKAKPKTREKASVSEKAKAETPAGATKAGEKPKGDFDGLKIRSIGPAVTGRVDRAAGVPGNPLVWYAAFAQGGLWKSDDGGVHWKPVFDDQPTQTVGSFAIAPSDPNVLYAGTGEANIRGNVQVGMGIFRSTDAGKSWTHVWKQQGQIGTIAIDPRSADVAFAAVLGHAFGPNPERGVYRTTDGGASWKRVLFKDENTGASDVAIDPNNPRIVFAGFWQTRRYPWDFQSGGPGSDLYRSKDGGETWESLRGKGLPEGIWGKIGVAVAPSDSHRVYALVEAEGDNGGLWRSDDGGDSWHHMSGHRSIRQRAWYYSTLAVDPTNPDIVWFPQVVPLMRTIDGGRTIEALGRLPHGDCHDLWIDPKDPRRMVVSNDGGVDLTVDGGKNWWSPSLPTSQFYNIDADNRFPYHVGGTIQDWGTASGPSTNLKGGGVPLGLWETAGGGEAGDFAYDPLHPGVVIAGEYGGIITHYDESTAQARNISIYPTDADGHGGEDLRVRFQWTAPIYFSPNDPRKLYHGANVLFRSMDSGQTWKAVSPDLTRNDKTKQHWAGGPITGDNTGVEIYDTIFSIAESPLEPGALWVGTDDGLVQLSRDDGATWANVTPKGMPEWATVEGIEASRWAKGAAYVAVDNHRNDDDRPYLFHTTDYGKTWTTLTTGLAPDAYLFVLREDAKQEGLLFLGTSRGLRFSRDAGKTWEELHAGLPAVAVTDLVAHGDDLVIGTSGRSIWALDDLTPIREFTSAIKTGGAPALLAPRAAPRLYLGNLWSNEAAGDAAPNGATIHYFLPEKAKGEVTIEVTDAKGRVVRKLSSVPRKPLYPENDPDEGGPPPEPDLAADAGLHRAIWNLRWDGAERIVNSKLDAGDPRDGFLAIPGKYGLKLTVDGKTSTAELTVAPDPRTTVPAADAEAQLEFVLGLRDALNRDVRDMREVRAMRAQANDLLERLGSMEKAKALVETAKRVSASCDAIEAKLQNSKAEITYDILAQKGGSQLYSKLTFLYESALSGDGPPTQGSTEVSAELLGELGGLEKQIADVKAKDLAEVERLSRELSLPRILLPEAKP